MTINRRTALTVIAAAASNMAGPASHALPNADAALLHLCARYRGHLYARNAAYAAGSAATPRRPAVPASLSEPLMLGDGSPYSLPHGQQCWTAAQLRAFVRRETTPIWVDRTGKDGRAARVLEFSSFTDAHIQDAISRAAQADSYAEKLAAWSAAVSAIEAGYDEPARLVWQTRRAILDTPALTLPGLLAKVEALTADDELADAENHDDGMAHDMRALKRDLTAIATQS